MDRNITEDIENEANAFNNNFIILSSDHLLIHSVGRHICDSHCEKFCYH